MRISEIANPLQVVIVSSEAEAEILGKKSVKKNMMVAAWHMPLSFDPPMYAVAIGKTRFSLGLIKKSKCFAVNFMPAEKEKEILFCGRTSGQTADKFRESGLTEEECEKIHCPRVKEALAWLECEVVEEVEAGDHIVFIGKVVNMAENNRAGIGTKRLFHLGGNNFGRL